MGCCCAKAKNSDPALHKEPLIPNSALHEDEEAHCAGADVISSSAAVVEAYVPESEPFVERFSSKRSLKRPEVLSGCDVIHSDASMNPMHQPTPEIETKSGEKTVLEQDTAPGTETAQGGDTVFSAAHTQADTGVNAKAVAEAAAAKSEPETSAKTEAEVKVNAEAEAEAKAEIEEAVTAAKADVEAMAKAEADTMATAAQTKAKAEFEAKTVVEAKAKAKAETKVKAEAEAKAKADTAAAAAPAPAPAPAPASAPAPAPASAPASASAPAPASALVPAPAQGPTPVSQSENEPSAALDSGAMAQDVLTPDPEPIHHHPVLIAIDIDGTLLNSSHELVPSVEAAVAEARDQGVHIVIATGKGPGPWSKMLLPRLLLPEPVIMLQGLMVCDPEGREVRAISLEQALVNELLELGENMTSEDAELNAFFYVSEARILCPRMDKHAQTMREYGESPPVTPPAGTTLAEHVRTENFDVYKLVCFTTPQRRASVRERLQSCVKDRARVIDSAPCAVEVISSGVSKATAVAEIAMELGVPPENVIAIGDGDNDVEMVAAAGLGIAMGNACTPLKASADRIVSTNDDDPPGVVEALKLATSGLW